jgi:soluble P-type ATPase
MNLQRRQILLVVAVAVATAAATPVLGQTPAPAARAPATTRNAASIPDFSGIWAHPMLGFEPPVSGPGPVRNLSRTRAGASDFNSLVGDYKNPILQPWAAELVKKFGDISLSGRAFPDPDNQCLLQPVPYIFWNFEIQMLQLPDRVIILYPHDQDFRIVRLNQPHPAKVIPTAHGDSVGHYEVDTLVVDKTGTLTQGKPKLVSMIAVDGQSEAEVLRLAASLERASEHPLAAAIVAGAQERNLALGKNQGFQSSPGKGIFGVVDGKRVALGNLKLFEELKISADALRERAEQLRAEGQTVMLVAVEKQLAGIISVADPIKTSTPEAVRLLHDEGVRIVMLTGDSKPTAEAVARRLGIDEVHAEVLPDRKAEIVKQLQSQGNIVAMAGDGVNDAPALAQAQVGIAMGTGTDIAMESAGVTLVKGDLRGIAKARRLSRATMDNIRQNLFFAFVYNILGVPIAAGILYPFFGVLLSPMIASAAMTFSSVSVITNALRLNKIEL